MLGLYAQPDVLVVGAGVTGIIAAISAARQGADVLLIEGSGTLGGMLTGGRLTRAAGLVTSGIYAEVMRRVAAQGGGDNKVKPTQWGRYTGVWDPESMQRVIIEMLQEAGVRVLLHATVTDTIVQAQRVAGVEIRVKSGRRLILASTVIDTSGDADVAALADVPMLNGRERDGRMQPMSAYVRVLQVDLARMVQYVRANPTDFVLANLPGQDPEDAAGYAMAVSVAGFGRLIEQAKREGFDWFLPRERILVKAGLLAGEVNLNVTRVQGNALNEEDLSRAEIEVRRQAYCAHDFLRRYVPGFEQSAIFDIAPRMGVRETRRVTGDCVVTETDVRSNATFEDNIGWTDCPIDIHDPDSSAIQVESVGVGYGIPLRSLLPKGLDGLLVAGRCASADHVAASSLRNTPACASMGEAAGVCAALAVGGNTTVRSVPVDAVQRVLRERGISLNAAEAVAAAEAFA